MWFAGGVTISGRSVTGSGQSETIALLAVAGEVAEAGVAFDNRTLDGGLRGQGAGVTVDNARRHAELELLERHCVTRWWASGPAAVWLSGPDPAGGRATSAWHIADLTTAQVVVAVSFDQDGSGFCFGAACRSDVKAALSSATHELIQGEVGLKIARMNARGRKLEDLPRAVQSAISLGDQVTKDTFFASGLVGPPSERRAAPRLTHPSVIVDTLGLFEDVFHVAEARFEDTMPTPTAHMPFAHMSIY